MFGQAEAPSKGFPSSPCNSACMHSLHYITFRYQHTNMTTSLWHKHSLDQHFFLDHLTMALGMDLQRAPSTRFDQQLFKYPSYSGIPRVTSMKSMPLGLAATAVDIPPVDRGQRCLLPEYSTLCRGACVSFTYTQPCMFNSSVTSIACWDSVSVPLWGPLSFKRPAPAEWRGVLVSRTLLLTLTFIKVIARMMGSCPTLLKPLQTKASR